MLDRETGRSKGFGFVSFEGANVEPILGFGNLEIDGKLIDVKLAQPRSQRENFSEGGANTSNNSRAQSAYGTGNYSGQQGQYNASAGGGPGNASGHAPFDPQALASLYTRMMQQMSMNQMMGGMPVMAGGTPGGFAGGMSGGIRMPGMAAGGMGPAMGGMGAMGAMGSMGNGSGMGVGRGGAAGAGPGNMMGGVPRGPRGAPTGPSAAGVGPQRAGQRGQHSHGYHPYAR
ncbi:hypothetical protein K474DRAFT_1664285 [Panus rudis PR-1116 ss-1]|nr:hypothetical protein K474DRAFT_1664285 [Panus rudis PR-1116 ss-1]